MLKRYCALLIFSIAGMLAAFGQAENKPSEYGTLLARVKGGDVSVDFKQLRISYMDSAERHAAKDTDKQKQEMVKALQSKNYKKAIQNADVVLESKFIDLEAHRVEQLAYQELHDDEKAAFHKAVAQGLIRSIMDSGDGKTAQTAYVVINVHEEYIVLQVLGLRPSKQSVVHAEGHSYDVLETKEKDSNRTVTLYFNVDIPFQHYLN